MTHLEIDKALVDLTREKCSECKSRLDMIDKDKATEKKAVQIEFGMYNLCGNAGHLFNTIGKREDVLNMRFKIMKKYLCNYPKLNDVFQRLSSDEQKKLTAAMQAEIFIRNQILCNYFSELEQAEAAGDTKNVFELKIKIGAVLNMLGVWEAWRIENAVYPHMFEENENV